MTRTHRRIAPVGTSLPSHRGLILGLVLAGGALQGANLQTFLLLPAYSAGAATFLTLVLIVGGQVFALMKQSLGIGLSASGHRAAFGLRRSVTLDPMSHESVIRDAKWYPR